MGQLIVGFEGEASQHLPLALLRSEGGGNVARRYEAHVEDIAFALYLRVEDAIGREVGHGATKHGTVGLREAGGAGAL